MLPVFCVLKPFPFSRRPLFSRAKACAFPASPQLGKGRRCVRRMKVVADVLRPGRSPAPADDARSGREPREGAGDAGPEGPRCSRIINWPRRLPEHRG